MSTGGEELNGSARDSRGEASNFGGEALASALGDLPSGVLQTPDIFAAVSSSSPCGGVNDRSREPGALKLGLPAMARELQEYVAVELVTSPLTGLLGV